MGTSSRLTVASLVGLLSLWATSANGGGLIGDTLGWIGARTGLKPIQQFGTTLDQVNAGAKQLIPPYGWIENQSSAFVRRQFLTVCETAYQSVTQPLVAYCSNQSDRMDDRPNIQEAETALARLGFFSAQEFSSVDIRVCPLSSGTEGIAPDSGKIYIRPDQAQADPVTLGALIAHEMTHIRQYRRDGSDQFKCAYSEAYVGCGFCQNDANRYEREAYAVQRNAAEQLAQYYAQRGQDFSTSEASRPFFNPAYSTGRVVIVNQSNVPIDFWLETQSRAPTALSLGPGQWSSYVADLHDPVFNITILTGTPIWYTARNYGIRAGGTYYLGWNNQGVADLAAYSQDQSSPIGPPQAFPPILGAAGGAPSAYGYGGTYGVAVFEVAPDQPAASAGIEVGDVITHLDGEAVISPPEFTNLLMAHAGHSVTLTVNRRGFVLNLEVRLNNLDGSPPSP